MTRIEIGKIVGVGRNTVGEWISKWQQGGVKALRVGSPGKPKGRGMSLDNTQQKELVKRLIEKTPDQLKMNFALWTRPALQQHIKECYGIDMPVRTGVLPKT